MNKASYMVGGSLALALFAEAAAPAVNPKEKVQVKQQVMRSTSDTFNYNIKKRLVVYEGNVRVVDQTLDLSCDKLTVIFMDKAKDAPKAETKPPAKPAEEGADKAPLQPLVGAGGNVKMLIAEGNVVIVNLKDKSRAFGDKAVYTRLTEQVVLTANEGNPLPRIVNARGGELSAPVIIYDRLTGNLGAKQGVETKQGGPKKPAPEGEAPKVPEAPEPPVRRLGPPKQ